MQMHVHARLIAANSKPFTLDMYPTILHMDDPFTRFPTYQPASSNKPRLITLRTWYPPKEKKEDDTSVERGRPILIKTAEGLRFDITQFTVKPNERISLTLENPDIMPHNLVIVALGAYEKVGLASQAMITDPKAVLKHYVPDMPEVLFHTRVIAPTKSQTIHFNAPKVPGSYPYLCTFPGHWLIMKGKMIVKE